MPMTPISGTPVAAHAAYAVLLPRADRVDAPRIARALARFLEVPVHDAAVRARRSCGIVAEGLGEEQARALAKRLEEEAVGGWVLKGDALATVPLAEPLKGLELYAAGFRPALEAAAGDLIAGRSIRLVAAAMIEREMILDVLIDFPWRRLRVHAERFDFRCLGGRMNLDARNNLRELVGALCALSPSALKGRGTETLLADRRSEPLAYDAVEDLEREERWLLTIA